MILTLYFNTKILYITVSKNSNNRHQQRRCWPKWCKGEKPLKASVSSLWSAFPTSPELWAIFFVGVNQHRLHLHTQGWYHRPCKHTNVWKEFASFNTVPAPPSPQTCLASTAPNVSTKSDMVQEKAVEEVSNLTEIGCRAGRWPPVHKLLETTDKHLCQIQLKSTPISTFLPISTRTVPSSKGGLTPLGRTSRECSHSFYCNTETSGKEKFLRSQNCPCSSEK